MDNKKYKITLADGTELDSLSLNGNNFISAKTIDEAVFEDNCSPVTINNGETDCIYEHMELVQLKEFKGEYWFILRNITEKELEERQLRSDIEYIAMMCEVKL
ncbi:MAG: hypothetical protein LUD81_04740 [Clostridiales bacterium]|nr:hypothetical protein [Clostridiales bacterium]